MLLVTTRCFLKSLCLATLFTALAGPSPAADSDEGKRPNILFIMSDDHAAHALSCYGSRINRTPNLDRLAREGMLFTNCFCTNSIGAPSRAVILTGKYNHINGIIKNGQKFDGSQQTMPKIMQRAGYETAIIGKWLLKGRPTGFDHCEILSGQGSYFNPLIIHRGGKKVHEGYVTDIITDRTIEWLKQRESGKPFFLMCHHLAPHRRWIPDDKHKAMYDKESIPLPETFNDDYRTRCIAAYEQRMSIFKNLSVADVKSEWPDHLMNQPLKIWKYQRFIKDYLRCVASVDDNVGRLLDYLDESGLAGNTMVVYTSDQGCFLGDHGWFDKRFMYEESLRMPLLVRCPGVVKAGTTSDEIVLNLDFAETFIECSGAGRPVDMQGRSILPILEGRAPSNWRTSMYYHFSDFPGDYKVKRHYGIRTERHKLIHFYHNNDDWELYDLENDPHELNNIYGDPKNADLVTELKAELDRLRKQYGDTE